MTSDHFRCARPSFLVKHTTVPSSPESLSGMMRQPTAPACSQLPACFFSRERRQPGSDGPDSEQLEPFGLSSSLEAETVSRRSVSATNLGRGWSAARAQRGQTQTLQISPRTRNFPARCGSLTSEAQGPKSSKSIPPRSRRVGYRPLLCRVLCVLSSTGQPGDAEAIACLVMPRPFQRSGTG